MCSPKRGNLHRVRRFSPIFRRTASVSGASCSPHSGSMPIGPMRARRFSKPPDMTHDMQAGLEAILRQVAVIPVLVIDRVEDAAPLARALADGGLAVLEITLRTEAAAECIRRIRGEIADVV